MTIDEAIAKYKEITNTDANCPAHCNISCDKCLQESNQIVEWLEELKELRKYFNSTEIGTYRFQKGYNKGIDDFVKEIKEEIKVDKNGFNSYYGVQCIDVLEVLEIAERLKGRLKDE